MSPKISLICAAAFVASGHSVLAHDIYSHLVDRWGAPCCNETDCRPARFRLTPQGVEMFVAGNWTRVPNENVQYRALPGDTGETAGGHWCGQADWSGNVDLAWKTRCAIMPPTFS